MNDFGDDVDLQYEGRPKEQYGISSHLPNYFKAVIKFIEESSIEEVLYLRKCLAQEILHLSEATSEENQRLISTLKPHIRAMFTKNRRNVVLEKLLLKRAIRLSGCHEIMSREPEILDLLDRSTFGVVTDSADSDGSAPAERIPIPPTGFWRMLNDDELQKQWSRKIPDIPRGSKAQRPPSVEIWWGSWEWSKMYEKILEGVRGGIWKSMKISELQVAPALIFPVVQGSPVKVRPCVDLRRRNAVFYTVEKMRLLNNRATRELQFRLMAKGEEYPLAFHSKKDLMQDLSRERALVNAIKAGQAVEDRNEAFQPLESISGSSTSFFPYASQHDLAGWYYQTPVKSPESNTVWLSVPNSVSKDQLGLDIPNADSVLVDSWLSIEKAVEAGFCIDKAPRKSTQRGVLVKVPVRWVCLSSDGAVFGSIVSVHECVGQSEALMLLTNCALRIPSTIYVDDANLQDRMECIDSAAFLYSFTLLMIGRIEAEEKFKIMKNSSPLSRDELISASLVHLGLSHTLYPQLGEIHYQVPESKSEKLLSLIDGAVLDIKGELMDPESGLESARRKLVLDTILAISGLFRWHEQLSRASSLFASTLNYWMDPLKFSRGIKKRARRKGLIHNLLTMREIVVRRKPSILSFRSTGKTIINLFSDACGEFSSIQKMIKAGKSPTNEDIRKAEIQLGGYMRWQGHRYIWFYRVSSVPDWIMLSSSGIHIGIFELLAYCINIRWAMTMGVSQSDYLFVSHCDNLGDCFSLVRSASSCEVVRSISSSWFLTAEDLEIEYYPVWLSGSRNVVADKASRLRKIEHIRKMFPDAIIRHQGIPALYADLVMSTEKHYELLTGIDPGGANAKRIRAR